MVYLQVRIRYLVVARLGRAFSACAIHHERLTSSRRSDAAFQSS